MTFPIQPLTRRSFSVWLTASGLSVAMSRFGQGQDYVGAGFSSSQDSSAQGSVLTSPGPQDPASFGQVSLERQAQDGRPPSEWLRSMDAEELREWLSGIEVPEAGVAGMTFWTHLTRDHQFRPLLIKGLTEAEQAKLHAAAHFGY